MTSETTTGPAPEATGDTMGDKVRSTIDELGSNPVALLAAGIAVGALLGALIPRLAKERELLEPVGRKLAERAAAAAQAAKEAGRQELDALLPDRDATKSRVTSLIGNVVDAAKNAARAD